jgi:hypothetical protein
MPHLAAESLDNLATTDTTSVSVDVRPELYEAPGGSVVLPACPPEGRSRSLPRLRATVLWGVLGFFGFHSTILSVYLLSMPQIGYRRVSNRSEFQAITGIQLPPGITLADGRVPSRLNLYGLVTYQAFARLEMDRATFAREFGPHKRWHAVEPDTDFGNDWEVEQAARLGWSLPPARKQKIAWIEGNQMRMIAFDMRDPARVTGYILYTDD